jgi:hypothetical protein
MTNRILSALRFRPLAVGLMATLFAASGAAAQTECGLCEREVVINADLAACFLERYGEISRGMDATVVVDLSDCTTRGIVEALPGPDAGPEPDTMFMVSQEQLDCLKRKLEDPNLVLEPAAKIDLESCG